MTLEVQGRLRRLKPERHFGPGPHPGTGSEQDVHAGEGGTDARLEEVEDRLATAYSLDLAGARGNNWFIAPSGKWYGGNIWHPEVASWALGGPRRFADVIKEIGRLGFIRGGHREGEIFAQFHTEPTREQLEALADLSSLTGDLIIWDAEIEGVEGDFGSVEELAEEFGMADVVSRHYGPGSHPGTGTPQDVHGEGGLASPTGARYVMATGDDQDAQLLDWHPESQHVLWISPQDYLDKVAEDMGRAFGERDTRRAVIDEEGVERLKDRMREGKPIDALWVDYELSPDQSGGEIVSQEGRHRAWAAIDLGVPYVPVITYFRPEGRGYWNLERNPVDLERVHPWREYLTGDPSVERHMGPGPHPGTGTEQEIHGSNGDGGSIRDIATRVMKDEWDVVDNVFEIEPGFNGWVLPDGTVIDIGAETHLNSLEQLRYHVEGWENEAKIRMYDAVVDEGFVRTGVIWGDRPVLFVQMTSYPPRKARESVDSLMAAFPDASFSWELIDRDVNGIDRHEFRRLSGVRVDRSSDNRTSIIETADQLDEAFAELERLLTGRHYGPGPHPGTGTEQEIHAGEGGWKAKPGEIAIDHGEHGRIVRIDRRNDDGTVNVTVLSGLDRLSRYKNVDADDLEEADEQEAEMWSSDSPRETAKRSVEIFGLTTDPREGGYILPNGKMLDFSGRAFGDTHVRGDRYLDHREVGIVLGEDDPGGTEGMVHFMKKAGAIRLGYYDDGVLTLDFATQPTLEQRQRIGKLSRQSTDLVWDITDYDPESGEMSVVDSGEGLSTPSIRNEMLASTEQLEAPDASLRTPRARRYLTERHYGPGPHPGTGTGQEVHAGDGGKDSVEAREGTRLVYDEENDRVVVVPDDQSDQDEGDVSEPSEKIARAVDRIRNGQASKKALEDFFDVDRLPPILSDDMVEELLVAIGFPQHRIKRAVDGLHELTLSRYGDEQGVHQGLLTDELRAHYSPINGDVVRQFEVRSLNPQFEDTPIEHRGQKMSSEHEWGNPDWNEDVVGRLSEIEEDIRDSDTEKAFVLDSEGNVTLEKQGTTDMVEFSQEDIQDFDGKVLIHNHPAGSPLSNEDVYVGFATGLEAMIAVSPSGDRFVVRYENAGEVDDEFFRESIRTNDRTIRQRFRHLISTKHISFEQAEANHQHEQLLMLERWIPENIDYVKIEGEGVSE